MSEKKRFKSMKTKIMFSALIPVIVSFALICTVFFVSLFKSLSSTARAEFEQISQKYAHSFETKLNNAMNYLSVLSSELELRAADSTTDREELQKIVFEIFDNYGLVDGSSVYFEPDAYDGKDGEYKGKDYGSDATGRIAWYYVYKDGKTIYHKTGMDDETEEFSLPHYTEAKRLNKPIYTDPSIIEIDGEDVCMFTLTFPINNQNGGFIGAVTVDVFLEDIHDELLEQKIYKTGYVIITNANERLIHSPNFGDVGKTRSEVGISYPLPPKDESYSFFNSKSIVNGKPTMVTIESIHIPQLDSYFYVSVTAPLSEINADAIKLIIWFIILTLIVVLAIAFLVFFLIGKLSAPLHHITQSVNKIAGGDYSVRIEGNYKAEFELVKISVNTLADSIEAYIKESQNSLEILKHILNGLDAVIYVSDPETDEILFINDNMKKLFGLEGDISGQVCWKIFQDNFDKRCDFCPCYKLDKDASKPIEWEEHNTVTKRHYRNVDTYIDWIGGKKVHLQHSVDITDYKDLQLNLDRRLNQQSLMSAIAQKFLSGLDMNTLMREALCMTGEFLDIHQAAFYKLSEDGVTLVCRDEWVTPAGGIPSSIGDTVVLEGDMLEFLKNLSKDTNLCLSSNDPEMKALMQPYRTDTYSFMTIPVFAEGQTYGVLDFAVDAVKEWSESDIHLVVLVSSLLSGVIERFSMETQLIAAKNLAEQGNKSKSEFLSRMSHEIRTPMNAIIGMTKIAEGTDDINKLRYCLSTINSSSVHLLGIINDILDMSKIEAGKFELDNEYFNIEKMLMKICNLIIDKAEQKNQALNINIGKKMHLSYLGDELRLSQVITNLLSNAVKFTPGGGSITLSVDEIERAGDLTTLRFKIADTGIGMTDEQMRRLFTSFEQADGSISRKFGGTGLGLAISKSIVKKMDGDIWVESQLGHGSTFIFDVKMQCTSGYKSGVIFGGINASDLKVLVVDDSPSTREQFADILGKFQIPCDTAEGGEAAVGLIEKACLNKKTYDVVFLDSEMPDLDGIQTIKRIKDKIDKNTVIVLMTFSQPEDCKTSFKELGIDRFLTKLLFPSSILNCINEVIGGTVKALDIKTTADKKVVDFSNLSILLVDDVDINREIFTALMEESKMAIDTAENGVEAVDKYKANPDKYDMIIMDIQMPEMDGYEATRIIRASGLPSAKAIPIIAMTANAFSEDIQKCLDSGMNDHISKPIDIDKVIEKILFYSKK